MSQREISALAKILSDPENANRSAEEIAQLCIDELDDLRAATHRLAVVGQINYGPEETVHTVALGPFRSPLRLADEERFLEVLKRPCAAARDAGRHLAWDSKSGTGRGRFMLVPMFMKPRDAWDFYRGAKAAPVIAKALEDLPEKVIKPACLCGIGERRVTAARGMSKFGVPTEHCYRHPEGR